MKPIVKGSFSKGEPKTLQDAKIPKSPRGIAIQIWFKNSLSFNLGGRE